MPIHAAGSNGHISQEQAESTYLAYPKHVGKVPAIREIIKAGLVLQKTCQVETPADFLLDRTKLYATSWVGREPADRKWIPKPENWFKDGRYSDDERDWNAAVINRSGNLTARPVDYRRRNTRTNPSTNPRSFEDEKMTETCYVCHNQTVEHVGHICSACQEQQRVVNLRLIREIWNGRTTDQRISGPPKRFWGAVWDTIPGALQQKLIPFITGEVDLLALMGPAGTGKSWTAWAIISMHLVRHTHMSGARYITWFDLNEKVRDSRLYGDLGDDSREYMQRLTTCELLLIDEFATARPYEAEFMSVMRVIHSRFDSRRQTVLITTRSEPELIALIGEAIVSRMRAGLIITMAGRDKRLS